MNEKIDILNKYKIGILAGGYSSERDISLRSGRAVFEALSGEGLNVVFIDVNDKDFSNQVDSENIDIAFIALHGKFGEDGKVQGLLEKKNIRYTGSGPEASRLALDKFLSREKFIEQGIRTPKHYLTHSGRENPRFNNDFPLVVKPRFEGSSIGLSIVEKEEDLREAILKASQFDEDVLVEEFIFGREITVGILGKKALPVVEIATENGVYDFNAKYLSKNTQYIAPADLDKNVFDKAQDISLKAHSALGCKDFSRVDMILSKDNKIFVLEVNTIPGLTERSLLPMAAKADNVNFKELCKYMLYGAVNKKISF